MSVTKIFTTFKQFRFKHYDVVLNMDQGTEFGSDFKTLRQSRVILFVVICP